MFKKLLICFLLPPILHSAIAMEQLPLKKIKTEIGFPKATSQELPDHLKKNIIKHFLNCAKTPDEFVWFLSIISRINWHFNDYIFSCEFFPFIVCGIVKFKKTGGSKDVFYKFSKMRDQIIKNRDAVRAPVFSAVVEGNEEKLLNLLQQGKNINAQSHDGLTALMQAVFNEDTKLVEILLQNKNIDLSIYDYQKRTALTIASSQGFYKIVQLLLQKLSNSPLKGKLVNQALFPASFWGHEQIVELLLSHEAKVNSKDEHGWTAICHAARNGHKNVVELLLKHNANFRTDCVNEASPSWNAITNGHLDVIKLLLEYGLDVDAIDEYSGGTLLMLAAMEGHKHIVEFLLENGADINYQNLEGQTALMLAAFSGQHEIVKFLLEQDGIDATFVDKRNYMAVDYAHMLKKGEIVNMIQNHNFECPICLLIIDEQDIVKTLCGHKFCGECIADWNDRGSNCPLCRHSL